MRAARGKLDNLFLLVIDHFDVAVLLYPKLTDDDVVHTTSGVCPSVGFIISAGTNMKKVKRYRWMIKTSKCSLVNVHLLG